MRPGPATRVALFSRMPCLPAIALGDCQCATSLAFVAETARGHTAQAEARAWGSLQRANNFPKDLIRNLPGQPVTWSRAFFSSSGPPSGTVELLLSSSGSAFRTSHALTVNNLQ